MANINLKIANTGEEIPVNDIELENVTNDELIQQLVASGMVTELAGEEYRLIGQNNQPVIESATLSSLGFKDGQTVTIVSKPKAA